MSIFNDLNGKTSSTRVAWFISVLIVMCVWGYTSIINKTFMHFTSGDAMWMATLFGLKVGQSAVEIGILSKPISKEKIEE